MQLFCIMCFSSSLICLLVMTCHGSVVNKYQNEPGYLNNTNANDKKGLINDSHISTTVSTSHNSSDLSSAHSTYHPNHDHKNLSSFENSNQSQIEALKRKERSTENDFVYPLKRENSHSEDIQSQSSPTIKKRSHSHDHGSSHHHHHHNDSNHEMSKEDKHHHEGHDEENDHDEYYDAFSGNDGESLRLPSSGVFEKGTQPESFDPCVSKQSKVEDNSQDLTANEKKEGFASKHHHHHPPVSNDIPNSVWLYASIAVIIISLCGLFSVAVIPIMQKWFYHTLLQFLVGLAVGSLSGDGLLHLMPHAILDMGNQHDHDHEDDMVSRKELEVKAVWRCLAALMGVFLFFTAERLLGAFTSYRKQKKESKISRLPKNMLSISKDDGANNGSVGEKLAQPKKNSYDHIREKDEKETIQMLPTEASPSKKGSNQSIHEIGFHGRSSFSMEPEATVTYRPGSESSVIVSEHHGHTHAHSHDIPQSVSAVAWMVILGDGLHNFCDGLAIGAAFATGVPDGFSTTVAVFCHELPHELGDFAMLLKTGMKVKQALFYNGLSSVLCFIGMIIGVALGKVHSAINWIFGGTAGMFLYIALVDMLPELSSPINTPSSGVITTLIVQVLGILIGVSIMLVIALYEEEFRHLFS